MELQIFQSALLGVLKKSMDLEKGKPSFFETLSMHVLQPVAGIRL